MKSFSLHRVFLWLLVVVLIGGGFRYGYGQEPEPESVPVSDVLATEGAVTGGEPAATAGEDAAVATTAVEEEETIGTFLMTGKYLGFLLVMIAALVLLFMRWINRWVRLGMLGLAFILFGLDYFFPLHPSPMCALTKAFMFKLTWGSFFPAFVAMFIAMIIPSFFGRKLFCGWVCPLGALQDLVNKIPFKWRWKQFNFGAFNLLRFGLLVMFVITFFAVQNHITFLGQKADADLNQSLWVGFSAFSIYEPINFFELLHWRLSTSFFLMMGLLAAVSLVLYRPFCYAICPIGAITWLLEKIAPARIRIDHSKCNDCGLCVTKSPCPTIKPMLERSRSPLPDCTSCGECLETCNKDAIRFSLKP